MAPERPAWIIKEIADILGFDQSTIVQLVIPDLESYTNETKLKAHLQVGRSANFQTPADGQDFLGPGPASKSFIYKYLNHQFPRLPTAEHAPSVPGPPKPLFSQPSRPYTASVASSSTSRAPSSVGGPTFTRQPPPHASMPDALESAFGPGGKVYQKNRDADISSFSGSIKHGGGSGAGSGSSTPSMHPSRQQAMRNAGAVTITEAKPRAGSSVGMSSGGSQKGKQRAGAEKIWDAPKSAAVKKLEMMLEALKGMQMSEGKVKRVDEGKECFCQARLHPLSPHTPQCAACGLIQCHVQPPDRACPSCFRPLLTPSSLARLVQRVAVEIEEQLAKEQAARDEVKRAEQRKIEAAAAFPYLAGTAGAPSAAKADPGHRVLTIDKGKGRITLTTTTTHVAPPAAPEPERYSEAVIARPRSPPLEAARTEKELAKNLKWRAEEDRPWGDMKAAKKGAGWAYVGQQIVEMFEEGQVGRRKGRKGKGPGTEGVNGRVVPGASGVAA